MRRPHYKRRTSLIVLFLIVALGLVLAGVFQGDTNETSAAPPITLPPGLYFYVTAYTPADGATEVALTERVEATFNRAVDPSTVNLASFYIYEKPSGPLLLTTITFNTTHTKAYLKPNAGLKANTVYIVGLSNYIKSKDLPILNLMPVEWSFKTVAPPKVLTRSPGVGATNVSVDQSVTVTFDKNMD